MSSVSNSPQMLTKPGYALIDAEQQTGNQWASIVRPAEPMETELYLGRSLIPSNKQQQFRGGGPRHIDRASNRTLVAAPWEIVEVKREMNPSRMDNAMGALLYEQELAARDWGVPRQDIHPVAVFSSAAFDVYSPPETIRVWASIADRHGIEVWVGTCDGFVRLTDSYFY